MERIIKYKDGKTHNLADKAREELNQKYLFILGTRYSAEEIKKEKEKHLRNYDNESISFNSLELFLQKHRLPIWEILQQKQQALKLL